MKERVGSKGMKKKQQSNQAHDTFQMRLKIPNDMGYKKLYTIGKGRQCYFTLHVS